MSLVSHADKALLKGAARRHSDHYEAKELLPEGPCGIDLIARPRT